jgi:hypothetical protein
MRHHNHDPHIINIYQCGACLDEYRLAVDGPADDRGARDNGYLITHYVSPDHFRVVIAGPYGIRPDDVFEHLDT